MPKENLRLNKDRRIIIGQIVLLVLVMFLCAAGFNQPVAAQDSPTSTPDADGNIYVVVQPNDSLWAIAARAGLSLDELLELNEIAENTVVQPGDLLLIGRGEPPPTPTSNIPTPTLPPPTFTPSPVPADTAICLTAFEDINQDGIFDPGEPLRPEVAFTIFNDQTVISNYISDGQSEPHCLENLEPGNYHITRSIAPDEILTTDGDWALTLIDGNELNLTFGSYRQSDSPGQPTPDQEAQFATRIAGTPEVSPQVPQGEVAYGINTRTLIIILLGIGLIALMLGVGVLVFWFAYGRNEKS